MLTLPQLFAFIRQKEVGGNKKKQQKKKVRREYFDDEAEVDSLESVSADEDNGEDAYELNSFMDDGEVAPQSQGKLPLTKKQPETCVTALKTFAE